MQKYSKTCLKGPLKHTPKIGLQYQLLLNGGQKYCRMLQGEHSTILSTFIKLLFVLKTFVLSIFVWLFKTGLTVLVLGFPEYKGLRLKNILHFPFLGESHVTGQPFLYQVASVAASPENLNHRRP